MNRICRSLLLSFVFTGVAMGQKTSGGSHPSPPTYTSPQPSFPNGTISHEDEGLDPRLAHRMEEARKVERKKRMVDTANRLLALTKQLQANLQGRQPTPEDEKRLDEIARLARTVKDQMRQ